MKVLCIMTIVYWYYCIICMFHGWTWYREAVISYQTISVPTTNVGCTQIVFWEAKWYERNQGTVFMYSFHFWKNGSRFPKETRVDQSRRQCSVEMIHGLSPSQLGWPSDRWCPKIRLKEPGPNGTSAGFQTDENRYYTLILARRPRSDTENSEVQTSKIRLVSTHFMSICEVVKAYFQALHHSCIIITCMYDTFVRTYSMRQTWVIMIACMYAWWKGKWRDILTICKRSLILRKSSHMKMRFIG